MNEVWTKPAVERDEYMKMVGTEVGVSSWHLVDQQRIDAFADITEDHQFIHVDPERVIRETPFGSTVAHGFLTVSLLSDRKSTRLNSSHQIISYAVFCLKKKKT